MVECECPTQLDAGARSNLYWRSNMGHSTPVAQLPLGGNHGAGKCALVDAEDFDFVRQWSWHLDGHGYAERSFRRQNRRCSERLQNAVMGPAPEGKTWDHINRDKLDCRKQNLRAATLSEQRVNYLRPNKTGYRGVYASRNWFRARIVFAGERRSVGPCSTAEEAARLYDAVAKELHGEFAVLNFPSPPDGATR